MRVAFNAILLRNQDTGVENYMKCLLHEFNAAPNSFDIDLKLFLKSNGYGKEFPHLEKAYAIPLAKHRPFRIMWEHSIMPSLLNNVDILHAPGYIAPYRLRKKTVLTVHDTIALTHPQFCSRMNAAYYRIFLPHSINSADKIIVPSAFVRDKILSLFNISAKIIYVIEHGVKNVFFKEIHAETVIDTKAKYHLPDKYLLYVGTHEPKKNIGALLAIYERLLNKHASLGLVIAGKKGWRSKRTKIILQKLKTKYRHIVETGFVTDEELAALYKLASVFVFPSLVEGFGLPPLEAMATGTPVVSTNVASIPEMVTDSALLAKPNDLESLYIEVKKVLENKELHTTLVEKGKQHSKKFSWEKTARNTASVYKSI